MLNSFFQSCYYQLRNISKVKCFLSINDTEKLVNTFVSSRLDLCNACPLQWLQLAQNVARDY